MSEPWIAQMRKGLVELCVLAVLREGEDYGYGIVQGLEGVEGLALTEGTIYPVLGRLTREGLVRVRVAASRAGPRRRYYALTARGRERLRDMEIYWRALSGGVEWILRTERGAGWRD
jgi:PadR family transcriptional regulator PadR